MACGSSGGCIPHRAARLDPASLGMLASERRALQIDDGTGKTTRILPGDPLHGIRDRRELVGAEPWRDEQDAGVLEIGCDELRRQLREVPDVACDNGAVCGRGVTKLVSVVKLRVADVMSADDVESTRTEHLGDARREILVEVKGHPVTTTRTSPG